MKAHYLTFILVDIFRSKTERNWLDKLHRRKGKLWKPKVEQDTQEVIKGFKSMWDNSGKKATDVEIDSISSSNKSKSKKIQNDKKIDASKAVVAGKDVLSKQD